MWSISSINIFLCFPHLAAVFRQMLPLSLILSSLQIYFTPNKLLFYSKLHSYILAKCKYRPDQKVNFITRFSKEFEDIQEE